MSRVKWDLYGRHDERALVNRPSMVDEVDGEAWQSMERGAASHKWYTKSSKAARKAKGEHLGTPLFFRLMLAEPCT